MIAEGVPPQRVHVVTNWSNEEQIVPVLNRDNPLRAELGLDVEPLLQQHEGVRAVFEKACAEAETEKQLQALAGAWEESKLRSELALQVEQERGDEASVAAVEEAKAHNEAVGIKREQEAQAVDGTAKGVPVGVV